jgi:hypothetical protein
LQAVPEFLDSKRGTNAFLRMLKGTRDKTKTLLRPGSVDIPKILELVGRANVLGMVKYDNKTLVIYDGKSLALAYSLFDPL